MNCEYLVYIKSDKGDNKEEHKEDEKEECKKEAKPDKISKQDKVLELVSNGLFEKKKFLIF